MNISSGLNTVSSLYGQQKGNQMKTPASLVLHKLYAISISFTVLVISVLINIR